MQKIRNAGLRVALDPMYGVSEIPLKTLLKQVKFIEDHDKNANQRINILQQEA